MSQDKLPQVLELAQSISDEFKQSEILRELAKQLTRQNKFQQALDLTHTIISEAFQGGALIEIVEELAQQNKFQQALDLAQSVIPENYRTWILRKIAKQLIKAGEPEQAKEVFQKALEWVPAMQDQEEEPGALNDIAKHLAQLNEVEQALKVARSITSKDFGTWGIVEVVNQVWEAKNPDITLEILPIIQQEWLAATTKEDTIYLLPIISQFLVEDPGLLPEILKGLDGPITSCKVFRLSTL